MKKLFTILLCLLCICACTPKQEEPAENIVGGWKDAEDGTITKELEEIFNKAAEGYTGMNFKPLQLLATQLVSGTNYKFLCEGTTVIADPVTSQKIVTVYQDLQGNCKITDVEDVPGSAVEDNTESEAPVLGGWKDAEDGTITDELKEIFDKAMEGYTGMGFTPIQLLATQLVSGTNYKFLCEATSVTAEPVTSEKIVTVYQDLQGNCKIIEVEDYEPAQLLGGWTDVEDGTLTKELIELFQKASEGYTGLNLTPLELLATQVVAGTNYRFLCDSTTVTAEPVEAKKIVTVYEDLEGNASIINVEDYE